MEIITRAQAFEKKLTRYFTGKPCKHGHLVERWVSSCACLTCHRKNVDRYVRPKGPTITVDEANAGVDFHHFKCHPDDGPAIKMFCDGLMLARSIALTQTIPIQTPRTVEQLIEAAKASAILDADEVMRLPEPWRSIYI